MLRRSGKGLYIRLCGLNAGLNKPLPMAPSLRKTGGDQRTFLVDRASAVAPIQCGYRRRLRVQELLPSEWKNR